jgi:predicted nucleotidyltransferase component of viral defense system
MPTLRDAQAIEFFHLAFLQVLQGRLDQAGYVLKGGANLRYFFDSVRYSEDIDLDVSGIEAWALQEKVDGALSAPALATLLRGGGLLVGEFSKPKQTETTQRWKVALILASRSEPLRTKIEFSRRNGEKRLILEAVPGRVVAPYALRAPTVRHYLGDAATEQKIEALAGRSETQARDVFDLDLLLRHQPGAAAAPSAEIREKAAGRALELPFAAFRDQVLPFVDHEVAELYRDPSGWEQIRGYVVERLLENR